MPMNIEIKVDAPGALPTIAGVESGLGRLETAAPRVGDALSKGLGAGAPAADKTKQSTQSATEALAKMANAGSAFTGLIDQLKREADMLDKIHGPAKRYAEDLQALDGLLMRGAVSTEEYAAQVSKMNAAIEAAPEQVEKTENATTKLGEAFEALKLPAVGAGVLELGHKVAELAEQSERLQDSFTEVANKTLKFADSTHSANQILAEQQGLSVKLNSTLDPTIELYDRVRIGSDNLRISHEEQIRMTQTLGETVQMANKPLEAAGEIMQRFAFAMESGVTDVRSVKQVMLEVPEAAKIWQETFHMTDQQILTAVRSGKLGARDLAMAWAQNGEIIKKVDDDFAKRQRLNEAAAKEFAEQVRTNVFGHEMSGTSAVNAAMLGKDSTYAKLQNQGFTALGGASDDAADIERGRKAIADLNEDIKNGTGAWRVMGDAKEKALSAGVEQIAELPGKLMDATTAAMDLGRAFGVVADKWEQGLSPLGRQTKLIMDNAAKMGEAKLQLAALTAAMKAGGPAGDDARKQYEALMTTLNDGRLPAAIKLWDGFHEPVRTFHDDMFGLNELLVSGAIDMEQYRAATEKFVDTLPKPSDHVASAIEEINFQLDHFNNLLRVGVDMKTNHLLSGENLTSQFGRAADVGTVPSVKDVATSAQANTSGVESVGDKYDKAVAELNSHKNLMSAENYARSLQNIKEEFGASVSPAEKLAKEQDDLNELFGKGVLTFDDYQKKLQEITKAQEKIADSGHDFASGLSRGWHSIRDGAQDAATTIATSMKSAFDEVNADIVSMVTTGTADWGKLVSTIEADLAKIALQRIEAGIIGALLPGGGAVAAVAGSWAGSDTTIPHAANGYAGKVGGVGGTDTRLFAAMVTPGETVQIRTPEQISAQQRGGGQPQVNVHYHDDTRGQLKSYVADGSADVELTGWAKRNRGALQALLK